MTPEAQRIAIAKSVGWKDPFFQSEEDLYGVAPHWDNKSLSKRVNKEILGEDVPRHLVPDYLNDLNAMNQAESILGGETYDYSKAEYCKNICELLGEDEHDRKWFAFNIVHATAAQRAESFLKTIEKWEAQS